MERIWDRFLTEQDRAHLATVGEPSPGAARAWQRPALLLIDNYRAGLGDEPLPLLEAVRRWPKSMGQAGWDATERIRELLDVGRSLGLPIVHVTGLPSERSGIAGWRSVGMAIAAEAEVAADPHRFDLVAGLEPAPGEALIEKHSPSAFFGTPLASHLTACRVDAVVVCGQATSGCVRASVVDAVSHRIQVVVPEDAVYDRHEATHAMNLFDMSQKYAQVLPTEQVLSMLRTRVHGEV